MAALERKRCLPKSRLAPDGSARELGEDFAFVFTVERKGPPREDVHGHHAPANTEKRVEDQRCEVEKECRGEHAHEREAAEREERAHGSDRDPHGVREGRAHACEFRTDALACPRVRGRLEEFTHATIVT